MESQITRIGFEPISMPDYMAMKEFSLDYDDIVSRYNNQASLNLTMLFQNPETVAEMEDSPQAERDAMQHYTSQVEVHGIGMVPQVGSRYIDIISQRVTPSGAAQDLIQFDLNPQGELITLEKGLEFGFFAESQDVIAEIRRARTRINAL